MAATKFEQHRADFTDEAHEAAKEKIYPIVFGDNWRCESTSGYKDVKYQEMDGKKKIDRLFHFTVDGASDEITISVQERFRDAKAYRWRNGKAPFTDITITEYNHASGQPSEIYGIEAMYFVYGWYNAQSKGFGEVVVVNTADLLKGIVLNEIPYTVGKNDKEQTFWCFEIKDLVEAGMTSYYSPLLNPKG